MGKFYLYCFTTAMLVASGGASTASGIDAGADCAVPDANCQAAADITPDNTSAWLADLLNVAADDARQPEDTPRRWQFSLAPTLAETGPNAAITTQLSDAFAFALTNYVEHADDASHNVNVTRAISGVDALLRSLSAQSQATSTTATPAANLLNNVMHHAGPIRIGATLPVASSAQMQAGLQQLQTAINADDVTQHLAQHEELVMALAKFMGWELTGLLPSATDVQNMASTQLTAMANSIEGWALNNVSFTSNTLALANANSDEALVQWQWQVNHHHGDNSASTLHGTTLGASLRAMFGAAEY